MVRWRLRLIANCGMFSNVTGIHENMGQPAAIQLLSESMNHGGRRDDEQRLYAACSTGGYNMKKSSQTSLEIADSAPATPPPPLEALGVRLMVILKSYRIL